VKNYYTFRALHDEWNATSSSVIEYGDPITGTYQSLSDAIRANYDFQHPILRITYDTGLVMSINHHPGVIQDQGYDLPEFGWAIQNPSTGYTNLAVNNPSTGNMEHLVLAPSYALADGNGFSYNAPLVGNTTNLTVVRASSPTLLKEEPDGSITIVP